MQEINDWQVVDLLLENRDNAVTILEWNTGLFLILVLRRPVRRAARPVEPAKTNEKIPRKLPMKTVVMMSVAVLALFVSSASHPEKFLQTAQESDSSATGEPSSDHQKLTEWLAASQGNFVIPAGTYELDATLEIDLEKMGAVSVRADGPVTLIMNAPGPAIRIRGSLTGRAHPEQIKPSTWRERMPLIDGIEIIGGHEEADGIEIIQTMQAIISRVTVRRARHAIRFLKRNRNTIISDCQIYHNEGIGIYLDNVDFHQINIANSHISYNQLGGIVVRGGNVRNLHITGCDIEANMPNDPTPTRSANIFIDQSADDRSSIAEIAITGCTIQHFAHYHPEKQAPGGANIRILGNDRFQPNMITITGNVMSDTHTHIHLKQVTDVTITGSTFFTTEPTDILIEESARVTVSACSFNPRESVGTGEIILRNSTQCVLSGLTMHNLLAGEAAITLEHCTDSRIANCIISNSKNGVVLSDSVNCVVKDCTVVGLPEGGREVIGEAKPDLQVR